MKSSISSKGQVTIPKTIRDRLGLRAGTVLQFEERDGKVIAFKADQVDSITALFGILANARSSDEVMGELRGDEDLPPPKQ